INNSYDNTVRSTLRLTQALDFIAEGLSATGLFAFDVTLRNRLVRARTLPSYYAEGRDENGELILTQTQPGSEDLSYGMTRYSTRRMYMEGAVSYGRTRSEERRVGKGRRQRWGRTEYKGDR